MGWSRTDDEGADTVHDMAADELTDSANRNWLAGTHLHELVLARVEAREASAR